MEEKGKENTMKTKEEDERRCHNQLEMSYEAA